MTSSASGFSNFGMRTVNSKRGADSAPTSLRAGGLKQQGFAHLHGVWNDQPQIGAFRKPKRVSPLSASLTIQGQV